MEKPYIEERDGGYWVAGTRVSLDSVVWAFKRGASPESIKHSFPLLTLEHVYGAITYYLAHEEDIDRYLDASEHAFARQAAEIRSNARDANPPLFERLSQMKQDRKTSRR